MRGNDTASLNTIVWALYFKVKLLGQVVAQCKL